MPSTPRATPLYDRATFMRHARAGLPAARRQAGVTAAVAANRAMVHGRGGQRGPRRHHVWFTMVG